MKVLLVLSDTRLTEYQLAAIVVMKFLVLENLPGITLTCASVLGNHCK